MIDYTVPAADVDLAEAHATFDTNFFAVINICQTFLPLLLPARGTIVQIGSVSGVRCHIPSDFNLHTLFKSTKF
jgi:1-acylglycerone phosphate reductase